MNWRASKGFLAASLLWVVIVSAAGLSTGCGEPCRDLSERVCRCKSTEIEQRACLQGLDSYRDQDGSSAAQQEICLDLLPGCNCDKLAAGDLAACGLAREAALSADADGTPSLKAVPR